MWRLGVILGGLLVSGCARGPEPVAAGSIQIDSDQYEMAFDAALEAARQWDLTPALRDRRAGVIVTEPRIAASVLEPWSRDPGSFDDRVEHTLSMDRRRARFEFVPAAAGAAGGPGTPGAETGQTADADILALSGAPIDLTTYQGPIELRVWVSVERQHTPGVRRTRWSRRGTSRSTVPGLEPFWTPVARDVTAENQLLATVAAQARSPEDSP